MNDDVKTILLLFDEHYPQEDKCYLNYTKPYELLFATILSAQCTDDRVNIVTADLFRIYDCLEAFAEAPLKDMEEAVRTTGFYHNKAKNIIASAGILLNEYGGKVPADIDALTNLPGVGRKTANVVRGHVFHIPSIVVDTHVKRVSGRLGLTENTDPVKIEFDLMEALPREHWIRYNQQAIAHGRKLCRARNPLCNGCFFVKCIKNPSREIL